MLREMHINIVKCHLITLELEGFKKLSNTEFCQRLRKRVNSTILLWKYKSVKTTLGSNLKISSKCENTLIQHSTSKDKEVSKYTEILTYAHKEK